MSAVMRTAPVPFLSFDDTVKLEEMKESCHRLSLPLTDHQILVNVDTKRLHLIELGNLFKSYRISTAKNGVGQKENTGKTPLGLHSVGEKIGEGSDPFEIFRDRMATGEIAAPTHEGKAIVGRILWLNGEEAGFNKSRDAEGNVVDSHDRYIYIHGTNDTGRIGQPVSGGCVRMLPEEVVELFAIVPSKTPVYIYE